MLTRFSRSKSRVWNDLASLIREKVLNKNSLLAHICRENSMGLGFECFLIQIVLHSFFWSTLHRAFVDPFLSWCLSLKSRLSLGLRRTWELVFVHGCLLSWLLISAVVFVVCNLPMLLCSCCARKVAAWRLLCCKVMLLHVGKLGSHERWNLKGRVSAGFWAQILCKV